MAADATLGRGAYLAAGGGIEDYGLAASKGMTKIGEAIAKPVAKELNQRREDFKAFAESELSRNPGLNDAEYTDFHDKLMQKKSDFLWGDSLSRSKIIREINEMKAQQDGLEEAKKQFAESSTNNKGLGGNDQFILSPLSQQIADAMKGAPVWQDGVPGYIINDKFYDKTGITRLIEEQSFDEQSANVLSNYVEDIVNRSQKTTPGVQTQFDWDTEYRKIMNTIVNKGSVRSLANDEIIAGRSFYGDFVNHLQDGTYAELGISTDMVNVWNEELSPDDGITFDDATAIIESLLMDDKLSRHYLSTYYTRYLEQNWNGVQNQKAGVNNNMGVNNQIPYTPYQQPTQKLQGKIIEQADGSKMWSAI